MTNKWLEYPMCDDTRPSVLWDNLTALQPESIKDVQTTLFLRKLLRHISNLINSQAFKTMEELIQRCNELWMSQTPEEAAAAAAAVPNMQSPFQNSRRSSSLFRRKMPGGNKGGRSDGLCFYHSRFGNKATSARRAAPTRKTNRPAAGPHFAAAAGPIPTCCPPSFSVPELVTAMSTFPTKNLIFLQDSKSNLKFLVDSGASISILSHSSSAPSTGLHLVGANGKLVPAWGRRRRQTVSFAGHDFEFDFFLAAVTTPIIAWIF
jgi:hypothetical protein